LDVAEGRAVERAEEPVLQARELLARYGLHAKKSWGQNFLVDERAYAAIVAACELSPGARAVEIGAGLGTLTSRLLRTGAQVTAIERERDMCEVLRRELGGRRSFTLREENALQTDYAALAGGEPLVIVGNLPYQIAAPLLFRFLAARAAVRRIVVMVQREVANRLLAQPDTEDYSSLTAQVQLVATVRRVCHVGRHAFIPAPRVESTVVQLDILPTPAAQVQDPGSYAAVVRAAFGQRRKTLRNALHSLLAELPAAATNAAVARAQIDLGRRGETLTVHEFARLANELAQARKPNTDAAD
jgi:16S rRNA (adenine1518-N6/adenine1519-N6)-dimethyltransferase